MKKKINELKYYCDESRHLVCKPYSEENLHEMARELKLGKWWYHKSKSGLGHYDIPKKRIEEITALCEVVSTKEIIKIIKGERTKQENIISTKAQS